MNHSVAYLPLPIPSLSQQRHVLCDRGEQCSQVGELTLVTALLCPLLQSDQHSRHVSTQQEGEQTVKVGGESRQELGGLAGADLVVGEGGEVGDDGVDGLDAGEVCMRSLCLRQSGQYLQYPGHSVLCRV